MRTRTSPTMSKTSQRPPTRRATAPFKSSMPPPKPVSEPSAPTTRWHGTTIDSGFAPLARPTARPCALSRVDRPGTVSRSSVGVAASATSASSGEVSSEEPGRLVPQRPGDTGGVEQHHALRHHPDERRHAAGERAGLDLQAWREEAEEAAGMFRLKSVAMAVACLLGRAQ